MTLANWLLWQQPTNTYALRSWTDSMAYHCCNVPYWLNQPIRNVAVMTSRLANRQMYRHTDRLSNRASKRKGQEWKTQVDFFFRTDRSTRDTDRETQRWTRQTTTFSAWYFQSFHFFQIYHTFLGLSRKLNFHCSLFFWWMYCKVARTNSILLAYRLWWSAAGLLGAWGSCPALFFVWCSWLDRHSLLCPSSLAS